MTPPFWTTFYSYKGGVGRSLALANVAALLVKRGRRVVLIDFDLEAPGLDAFAEFAAAAGQPGVVEYVSEFTRRQVAPDLSRFVHACELPGPLRGKLWVMPAGRKDTAYNRQLAAINWVELYERGLGGPFVENWKLSIEKHFQPDFVFVDSRTGLTEVGGICTTQFPDLVMMLFGLNEQNVRGVATVAESIRQADPERVPLLHYVATPVPNLPPDRHGLLTERLDVAAKHLGVKVTSAIRYYPPAALSEWLFTLVEESPQPAIVADYERLRDEIIKFHPRGLDSVIKQVTDALPERDTARLARLERLIRREFTDRPEGCFLLAQIALSQGETERAVGMAERASQLDPAYERSTDFLLAHYERTERREAIVELCSRLLERPERIPDGRYDALQFRYGQALMNTGRPVEASDAFETSLNWGEAQGLSPAELLSRAFNAAEAHRRATDTLEPKRWRRVLDLFEQSGMSSEATLPLQANRWQSIHIAFAATGDLPAAREALGKARRAAEAIGEIEDVFSVKVYRQVPATEFLTATDEMLAALDRGELWDGMGLSVR